MAFKQMMTHLLNTRLFPMLKSMAITMALLSTLLISACSVHKIDIQQGNVITQELFEKLRIGMDKRKVERLLGTPLIVDPFHRDRWDYIYVFKAGNTDDKQNAHFSLHFENGLLININVLADLPKEADVKKPGKYLR